MAIIEKNRKQHRGSGSEFIVRINGGQGISVKGKIEHVHSGQVQYFNDFLEMLLLMQYKLDQNDYPQCDTELRTFDGSI